jgi:hypothetical protein
MLGTKTYIVLPTPTAVKDLLDKKSSICSSRLDLYLGHEIVGQGRRFVIMVTDKPPRRVISVIELTRFRNTAQWQSVHKMIHNTLNVKTAVAYIPYQDLENRDMMLAFLDEPEAFL